MDWYKVEENDAYKQLADKFFVVATKHRVLGGTRYFVAKPFFRYDEWWWEDVNDKTVQLVNEDDRYFIFTPISF